MWHRCWLTLVFLSRRFSRCGAFYLQSQIRPNCCTWKALLCTAGSSGKTTASRHTLYKALYILRFLFKAGGAWISEEIVTKNSPANIAVDELWSHIGTCLLVLTLFPQTSSLFCWSRAGTGVACWYIPLWRARRRIPVNLLFFVLFSQLPQLTVLMNFTECIK